MKLWICSECGAMTTDKEKAERWSEQDGCDMEEFEV